MGLAEIGRCCTMPVEPFEQVEFARPHERRLVRFRVIVSQHVQDPVHDEQSQLVVERSGVIGELRQRRPRG